ncbi:unnamed protein product [Caenorhabditis brenneri]
MITRNGKMVSFQEKKFCQESVADLRAVLRVGLMLNFRATLSVPTSKQYVATSVRPSVGPQADAIFKDAHEIDLDPSLAESTHQSSRYSKILEYDTYSIVLMSFAHSRRDTVQWSSIITELYQFENQVVLEYVGGSIQKRTIFLEKWTYLLKFGHGRMTLQHPVIHSSVVEQSQWPGILCDPILHMDHHRRHRRKAARYTQMQPEPPLNYSDNFPRNSSTSEFTSSIFMDTVRREDQTPPNKPLKFPNNFPSIPEILAMGDKVMQGFSLPEVNPEPSSSQKEYDELCAEFETYLQMVQAKES